MFWFGYGNLFVGLFLGLFVCWWVDIRKMALVLDLAKTGTSETAHFGKQRPTFSYRFSLKTATKTQALLWTVRAWQLRLGNSWEETIESKYLKALIKNLDESLQATGKTKPNWADCCFFAAFSLRLHVGSILFCVFVGAFCINKGGRLHSPFGAFLWLFFAEDIFVVVLWSNVIFVLGTCELILEMTLWTLNDHKAWANYLAQPIPSKH